MDFGNVFLAHILEFHGPEAAVVVALAVNKIVFQRASRHWPGKGHGNAAKCPVRSNHFKALRHTEFQAAHIFQTFNGTSAV